MTDSEVTSPEPRPRNGRQSIITTLGIWATFLLSLTSISVVFWKGGAIDRQVTINTADIDVIKRDGSVALQAHTRMDDERISAIRDRLIIVEHMAPALTAMEADMREMRTDLRWLKDRLSAKPQP